MILIEVLWVIVICLTGGIASGKSTASRFLLDKGAKLIDADKLGHKVYEPGSAGFLKVVASFGEDIKDANGQIDRKLLGAKVFAKPDALKTLTDIVWPEIRRLAEVLISQYRSDGETIVILEAAVLFEAGWQDLGDEVWVVTAPPALAIERAMARDGLPKEAVENRLKSQLSNAERVAQADIEIENEGDLQQMKSQLEQHWLRLQAEF